MLKARPIFICGVGRSGTTLLQHLVSAHPDVGGMPETSFFRRYVVTGSLDMVYRQEGVEAALALLRQDDRFLRLNADEVLRDFPGGSFSSLGLYTDVLRYFSDRKGYFYVCDKDPRLIEYVRELHQAFPNSFLVHIVRDPRAVLASKKKAEWSRHGALSRHLLAYRAQMALGRNFGEKYYGANYIQVKYESLTSNPRKELASLCARLGLDFSEVMLNHTLGASDLIGRDELSWKSSVLQPISGSKNSKWATELTPEEISLTNKVCANDMAIFSYNPGSYFDALSLPTKLYVATRARLIKLASSIYTTFRKRRKVQIVST